MLLRHGGAAVVFAVLLSACATQPAYKISDVTEARALSDRAFDMFAEGDNEGAITALNAVIAYGTIDDADYARRAAVYGTLKLYDKALVDADRAVALAPRAWRRYLERAVLLQRVGRYSDAIADLDQAVGLRPTEVEPLRRRAYLKVVAARFDDAIRDYDDLSAMLPNSDTGALGRGAALYLAGRWREAAAQFSNMLETKPHDGLAALWLAKARGRAGQFMGWDEVEHHAGPEPEWLMTRMLLTAEPGIDAAAPLADIDTCERAVFLGVWRTIRHGGDGATNAFRAAETACPPDSIEASEARTEIARLKKN
jgi:tetratricopeptide (TPR) repeat protein